MPRISAPIEELVSSKYKLREITISQLVSFMRCGEYFRNEILEKVSPWDFSKDPYSLLLHHLMMYVLNYYGKNEKFPTDDEIVVRFSIAQNLLRSAGHSFIFHNKNNDILFSLFKLGEQMSFIYTSDRRQLLTLLNKFDLKKKYKI